MKWAIITGGASGLGLELTNWYIENNYSVLIIDKLPIGNSSIKTETETLKYFQADISKLNEVNLITDKFARLDKIDVFILNAFPRNFKLFWDFSEDEIINFSNVAYIHQLVLLNSVVRKMIHQKHGKIILIGSKSSFKGYSTGSLYCSLKMAYLGLYDSISRELANIKSPVTVSMIHPDSFSDTFGSKHKNYEFVKKKILTKIKAISDGRTNRQHFALKLSSKIVLFINGIRQSINFFIR